MSNFKHKPGKIIVLFNLKITKSTHTFKSIRIESNCCIDGSFHKKRMVQSITVFVKKVELNIEVLHLVTIFDDSSYNVGVIAV